MIEIPLSTYSSTINLTLVDAVRVRHIHANLTVLAYEYTTRKGAVGNITQYDSTEFYARWLRRNIQPNTCFVAIIGGIDDLLGEYARQNMLLDDPTGSTIVQSARLVRTLETDLKKVGFTISYKDVLGRQARDVTLFSDGRIGIERKPFRTSYVQSTVLKFVPGTEATDFEEKDERQLFLERWMNDEE